MDADHRLVLGLNDRRHALTRVLLLIEGRGFAVHDVRFRQGDTELQLSGPCDRLDHLLGRLRQTSGVLTAELVAREPGQREPDVVVTELRVHTRGGDGERGPHRCHGGRVGRRPRRARRRGRGRPAGRGRRRGPRRAAQRPRRRGRRPRGRRLVGPARRARHARPGGRRRPGRHLPRRGPQPQPPRRRRDRGRDGLRPRAPGPAPGCAPPDRVPISRPGRACPG